jgi:hypothetical protein
MVELRLAVSSSAASLLSEPRLRRLLEIEAQDIAFLAPGPSGPLGDYVASVWVEQPTTAKVLVEVRLGDHSVEHREIVVRGLAPDVAARLVAVAAAELVRSAMVPVPKPAHLLSAPLPATPLELERASFLLPALVVSPDAELASLPGSAGVLAGPGVGIGFRYYGAGEALSARWLTGSSAGSSIRWLEVSAAADYRVWLSSSWRLCFGGLAGVSSVHIGGAEAVDNGEGQQDTWSGRAGAVVGIETKIADQVWAALVAEPGAVLRPVRYIDATGKSASVEGVLVGIGLALHFEPRLAKPPTPPL